MTVRTASLVVLALIAPFASAEDAAKEVADAAMPSKDLLDGMMIGRISEFESQIRDAWVVLHFLEKEHGDGIDAKTPLQPPAPRHADPEPGKP